MKIDWSQASTKRGAVLLVFGITAATFIWFGKDGQAVMAVAQIVAGAIGVAVSDK